MLVRIEGVSVTGILHSIWMGKLAEGDRYVGDACPGNEVLLKFSRDMGIAELAVIIS